MPQAKQRGEYPADWHTLAKQVKEDADLQCVRCMTPHNPNAGYCLTVHHFDGDKDNNKRWNLMALCQRCHLSVQARVDPQIALMFDPSPWALPYLAGFYHDNPDQPKPVTYDLVHWIDTYQRTVGAWPTWAPGKPEM